MLDNKFSTTATCVYYCSLVTRSLSQSSVGSIVSYIYYYIGMMSKLERTEFSLSHSPATVFMSMPLPFLHADDIPIDTVPTRACHR